MATKKFSAFTSAVATTAGDVLVGLHAGINTQFTGLTTPFSPTYGGTGINNGSSTITIGGSFSMIGAFTFAGTLTGNTAVTFPTSGTLATTGQIPSFPVSLANGGTNNGLIANAGGIVWSDSTKLNILAGTATAGLPLLSGASVTPSWSAFALSLGGALTTAGALTTVGAFGVTFNFTGTTNVTFPTSGTLATTSGLPTLPLSLAQGGTGASLTASNGGIFYSNATTGAILAGTATANQVLMSGANSAPAWSTATYPSTTTASQLLYSSSTNVIAGLATANSAVLVTTSAGVPVFSSTMTNGQLIIGSTGATPTASTLTAGNGISIGNSAAGITIASTGSGMSWTTISGTTQAAAVDSGYIVGNAGQTTITLPATAAIGSSVSVRGLGAGGWILAANSGQTIKFITATTSSGGSFSSAEQYDSINVTCIVANTTWSVSAAATTGLTIA